MLSDDKLKKELENVISVMTSLNKHTDGRYGKEIDTVQHTVQNLSKSLLHEANLRRSLERYKSRGFKVLPLINQQYRSLAEIDGVVAKVIPILKELDKMLTSFNEFQSSIPDAMRQKFLAVVHDPDKFKETTAIWGQIHSIIARKQ